MSTLDRRVQILFDPARYAGLEAHARAERRSVASVVREAVDERLARSQSVKEAALVRFLDSADPVPDTTLADWDKVKDSFDDRSVLETLR